MSTYYKPGRYVARVITQGFTEAKSSGNPMIVVTLKPTYFIEFDNEGAESLVPVNGQYERTARVVLDPNDAEKSDMAFKKLRYAGFTGTSFNDLNLVGSECRFTCEPGEYEGKETENWGFALPPMESRAAAPPLDASAVKRLDALFGKTLKGSASSKKPATVEAKKAEPVPAGAPDDEVPF